MTIEKEMIFFTNRGLGFEKLKIQSCSQPFNIISIIRNPYHLWRIEDKDQAQSACLKLG